MVDISICWAPFRITFQWALSFALAPNNKSVVMARGMAQTHTPVSACLNGSFSPECIVFQWSRVMIFVVSRHALCFASGGGNLPKILCHWRTWSILTVTLFSKASLMVRFMGPTWGPSGAERTHIWPKFTQQRFANARDWQCKGYSKYRIVHIGIKPHDIPLLLHKPTYKSTEYTTMHQSYKKTYLHQIHKIFHTRGHQYVFYVIFCYIWEVEWNGLSTWSQIPRFVGPT